MPDRLQGLRGDEQTACRIAERALGAVATPNDVRPHQAAVDAFLEYPDGRRAAFEVTRLATDGGASNQLDHLLSRDRYGWPLPGKWQWIVEIGDPRDLPRLRRVFDRIVLLCEEAEVTHPRLLSSAEVDADVRWLTHASSVEMRGRPTVPAVDGHRRRRALLIPPMRAAFEDESFSELEEALAAAFGRTLIQRHVAKLERTAADERHLFIVIGVYDLPFSLFLALGFGDNLPSGAPALPTGLTHLWLAPVYGHRVLIGSAAGWAEADITFLAQQYPTR
jgi:hypothetical protein